MLRGRTRSAAAVLLLAGAWTGCECDPGTVGAGTSSLSVTETRIDLGRVFIGNEARRTFQLLAPGTLPVSFRASLGGDTFGFIVGPASGTLGPNGAQPIELIFRPQRVGSEEARLVFDSDATEVSQVVVTVTGEGVEAPDCEDGNGCTVDSFDLEAARCVHRAEPLPCTDFSACTVVDTCVDGVCLGRALSCDDDNPCTDDLCDPATGCLNEPTRDCDDGNPCTVDVCGPNGCMHQDALDGTFCDDFEVCTMADICFGGACIGVSIPDGTMCDDNEPCSKAERCIEGECLDPGFTPPAVGGLVYSSTVGVLADDAPANPIVDRDGTVYVGLADGAVAVDQCGETVWTRNDLGLPTWRAATSLPGRLYVPIGDRLVYLDARTGVSRGELRLSGLAPAGTSSTATVTTSIVDMALRGSGAVVASVVIRIEDGELPQETGALVEIDRGLTLATVFRRLGPSVARRVVVDRDEALVVVLTDGERERLVRFGLDGLPETSWSTSATSTAATDIALGPSGEAIWTHGLVRVTTQGRATALLAPGPAVASGSALVGEDTRVFVVRPLVASSPALVGEWCVSAVDTSSVTTTATVAWTAPILGGAEAVTPALDGAGTIYVATKDGALTAITADGQIMFRTELGISLEDTPDVALGITPRGAVVLSGEGRVLSIKGVAPLANTPWPRHRRDNLSTGHR